MDFSLSSSLVGSAVLGGDKLALDLQFATDKTLTARKGPTPVFTRGSTGRFVGSNGLIQSAAINAPRFDHDPVTGVCKGLLMEESRTNDLIRSNEFTDVSWAKSNITTGSTINLSPDGGNNATLLIAGAGIVSWIFRSGVAVSGKTVTYFAKSSGKRWSVVDASSGAGTAGVWFDLQNGVVGTIASGYTASIEPFPNGFYRCRVTYPASGAGTFTVIGVSDNNSSFVSTTSGSDGIIIYGAQLEAGAFPTSYIPTITASVVRSADVCSITGSDFSGFYNQPEGTLFADVTPQTVAQASVVVAVNTTSFQNAHLIYKTDAAVQATGRRWVGQTSVGPAPQTQIATSTDVAIARSRLSYAYKLNDFAFAYAGGIVGTDNLGTIPSPTAMRIGARDDGLSINGHLAAIRYYKKRLSNPRLQAITV